MLVSTRTLWAVRISGILTTLYPDSFMLRTVGFIACFALLLLTILMASCVRESPALQPIPFSHRQHIEKSIRCTFCHSGAEKYSVAGIPSVTLCMSCHSVVKTDSPEITKVKQYLDRKEEIPWRRIYELPEDADVFFSHRRHAASGVKCMVCHGDVAARDTLRPEVNLTMGFCVRCHRATSAKFRTASLADDCATCHR
jgi:hypothetical protein